MEERLYFGGALFLLLFLSIFFFYYLLWLTVEKCVMWAKKKDM
jgi:hypothetical protein